MTIMVTIFGQHYFHNVDLRYASINIMEIMLTKKSDIIVHSFSLFGSSASNVSSFDVTKMYFKEGFRKPLTELDLKTVNFLAF